MTVTMDDILDVDLHEIRAWFGGEAEFVVFDPPPPGFLLVWEDDIPSLYAKRGVVARIQRWNSRRRGLVA